MRYTYILFISISLLIGTFNTISAQPELEIEPDDIYFTDVFDRLENMYFINEGNQPLIIDSIAYLNEELYLLRYDQNSNLPIIINPGDSVFVDCILAGYFMVETEDTSDIMYVYSNSVDGVEYVDIEIEFFENFDEGTIEGYVTEELVPLADTKIYFYYEGQFPIAVTQTDLYGYYSAELPPGDYTIAAEKDSFYLGFYEQVFDPFSAQKITLPEDSLINIDIQLTRMEETGKSISGSIIDSLANDPLKRGIVVARKGKHTPNKRLTKLAPDDILTAIIRPDGSYKIENVIDEDYYFIQAFSDYFLPTYYSGENPTPFWQNADSVYIDQHLSNYSIMMPRDSSLGGGIINGQIKFEEGSIPEKVEEVVVYATSTDYHNFPFTYTLPVQSGSFSVINLPYGNYQLRAQKIGLEDSYSSQISITPGNTEVNGVDLTFIVTELPENEILQPESVKLYQNYPNPFNPSTNIEFYIPEGSEITLKISNILGEEIEVLKNGFLNKGRYSLKFDGSSLSSGTYILTLITKDSMSSKKILLLK